MPDFSSVLSVLSCILASAALFSAVRTAIAVQELRAQLASSPLSRIASLETSHELMLETVTDLANRVKMMKVRNVLAHTDNAKAKMPDAYRDPDGWRKAMNASILASKHSNIPRS